MREESRTRRLADYLVSLLNGETEEVRLEEISFGISDAHFISERDRLLSAGQFDHPMFDLARSFAAADLIVIAAPFWDLSFPASLKQYLEQINVTLAGSALRMFMNALSMTIGPMIFISVIAGITNMSNAADVGRMGGKLIVFSLVKLFVCTVLGVVFGLLFWHYCQPGGGTGQRSEGAH